MCVCVCVCVCVCACVRACVRTRVFSHDTQIICLENDYVLLCSRGVRYETTTFDVLDEWSAQSVDDTTAAILNTPGLKQLLGKSVHMSLWMTLL